MRTPNIAFSNLRAEAARNGVEVKDFALAAGVNRDTMGKKLSRKSPIALNEAFAIQKTFFPNLDIAYLFKELANTTEDGQSS